jgi:hypothetical protein
MKKHLTVRLQMMKKKNGIQNCFERPEISGHLKKIKKY